MLEVTWKENDNLALAVSTGIDSMTLLHLLNTTYKHTYQNLICLHVNHGLRPESKDEAEFIEKFCFEHDIKVYIKTLDLSDFVNQNKSIQDVSRTMRYEWFDEMMQETNSDILITAHHKDDQIETIAYRLLTGRIGRSSLGIEPVQKKNTYLIVRPFLKIPKATLMEYQQAFKVHYFEDASNKDTKYTRNYIRNKILPVINQREDLSADHLLSLNHWMNEARDLVDEQAEIFIHNNVVGNDKAILDRKLFNQLNSIVKVRVLDRLMDTYIHHQFSMKAYQEWFEIFNNYSKQSIIPVSDDWQFVVAYDKLLLCEDIEFNVNSTYIKSNEQHLFGNWFIETKNIESPLFVRTRMSGDRIQFYNRGNKHHKKVNRIMIDNKMEIHKRENCPILVYNHHIIAVGDIWIDSNFKNALTITYIGDDFNERFD